VKRRLWLCAAAASAAGARAQDDWRRVAVPYVTPQAWLRSLDERWYAPRSAEFAQAAAALARTLDSGCTLAPARAAWREAMLCWERLSAVVGGGLLDRSGPAAGQSWVRTLDFQPTRVPLIERAMADTSRAAAELGAPAVGLPALEWLLWRALPSRGAQACAYAQRVAARLADDARALAAVCSQRRERDEAAVERDFAQFVNQLVGGAQTLRWAQIGKPLREGRGHWPRAASGLTREAWRERGAALQALLAHGGGEGVPVSLEAFLRGRGLNPLADELRAAATALAGASASAVPAQKPSVQRAERVATALQSVLEARVAPTLNVAIGFSDADGD
jgi:predicted lipoprotein